MLQVARLAPRLLGDSTDRAIDFFRSQQNSDGGFKDRAGNSDLYYSVFGIEGLFALRAELPVQRFENYLRGFDSAAGLDLIHLSCLTRCWAMLGAEKLGPATRAAIQSRIEAFRSADGGYSAAPGAALGTAYGCFLAFGAYEDLAIPLPDSQALIHCISSLKATDGGYSNQHDLQMGLTPTTAAAVSLLRNLGEPVDAGLSTWLLDRVHPQGGFFATPSAPIPDLLSTATALHALAGLHVDFSPIRETTLDFIDTLWSARGAFHGNWDDDALDVEYTFYGLLSLGHLSV